MQWRSGLQNDVIPLRAIESAKTDLQETVGGAIRQQDRDLEELLLAVLIASAVARTTIAGNT
jgi:hypothetical protein